MSHCHASFHALTLETRSLPVCQAGDESTVNLVTQVRTTPVLEADIPWMGHERSAKDSDDSFAGDVRLARRKGLRRLGTFRVLVADDHRLMLAAVRRALADAEDFEIVSEVSVGSRVLPVVRETNPDVVLLDMRMPELDGLTCLARLRKHDPTIAVVILSSYNDKASIEAAREVRARLHRQDDRAGGSPGSPPERALRPTLRGLGRRGGAERRFDRTEALSERETVVLEAVARGLSNREIGRELWISEQTVKFHLRNLYRKLGVSSRTRRLDTPTGQASSLR